MGALLGLPGTMLIPTYIYVIRCAHVIREAWVGTLSTKDNLIGSVHLWTVVSVCWEYSPLTRGLSYLPMCNYWGWTATDFVSIWAPMKHGQMDIDTTFPTDYAWWTSNLLYCIIVYVGLMIDRLELSMMYGLCQFVASWFSRTICHPPSCRLSNIFSTNADDNADHGVTISCQQSTYLSGAAPRRPARALW